MSDIDHRLMTPPSLRVTTRRTTAAGTICVWDLRIAQPNVTHVEVPTLHSLEHFLGSYFRDHETPVLNVAPMGCQTGFYIVTVDVDAYDAMSGLLRTALEVVGAATEVPLANLKDCGWAANHSLEGAQITAAWLLSRRDEWRLAGPAPELMS